MRWISHHPDKRTGAVRAVKIKKHAKGSQEEWRCGALEEDGAPLQLEMRYWAHLPLKTTAHQLYHL